MSVKKPTPDLTDEELSEEVAKYLGWKRTGFCYQDQDESYPRSGGKDFYKLSNNGEWSGVSIPKFSTDFNAIRKVVMELPRAERIQFMLHLKKVVGYGIMSVDYQNLELIVFAEARDWCKAFLRYQEKKAADTKK
jgi:hypothetical protein